MPYLAPESTPPAFALRMPASERDACCAPAKTAPSSPPPVARRARLSDLDEHVHCSIIGTCMGTGELRKLVPRYDPAIDRKTSSDLEIHHAAVNLTTRHELVAKELSKALDTRHAQAIRRFKAAADEPALGRLWGEAMANGDVPGAYWALMTHPLSTHALRTQAFGDVHMLSHLVGASNRADIRRLAALEDDCLELRAELAQQQGRHQELAARHERDLALLEERTAQLRSLRERLALSDAQELAQELAQARAGLEQQRSQAALLAQRCAAAEERLAASERTAGTLRAEQAQALAWMHAAQAEIGVLEGALEHALGTGAGRPALPPLDGIRIAYVGGRPQSTPVLAALVAGAGGELLLHDGGLEDRKGLLPAMLARAQLVVYPVDCIGHNAMHVVKQAAARGGIPCHPLRKASLACFSELLHRVCPAAPLAQRSG